MTTPPPSVCHTKMKDGRDLCLRPLKDNDAPLIEAGIEALSDESRYHRFFSGFKQAPASVLKRLTDIDRKGHIAWGAVDSSLPDKPAIAAAHIIQSGDMPAHEGDFSIAVLDAYHHQGIARLLIACLFLDAVNHGFSRVTLDVLNENKSAISLFKWLGGVTTGHSSEVRHMRIEIEPALEILKDSNYRAMKDIFNT